MDTKTLLLLVIVGAVAFYLVNQQRSYQNAETWEILRLPNGSIQSVVIHRDAKVA